MAQASRMNGAHTIRTIVGTRQAYRSALPFRLKTWASASVSSQLLLLVAWSRSPSAASNTVASWEAPQGRRSSLASSSCACGSCKFPVPLRLGNITISLSILSACSLSLVAIFYHLLEPVLFSLPLCHNTFNISALIFCLLPFCPCSYVVLSCLSTYGVFSSRR